MNNLEIALMRLHTQRLTGPRLATPHDVVELLGAVQAQEYGAAKWALAQRCEGTTDADVDEALADGSILRTHAMRPTWHFVTPEDIRWLLDLTAPRVHALNAYYYRQLGLDGAVFGRSNEVMARVLSGGKQLTRLEIAAALEEAGVQAAGVPLRLPYILMQAELDQVICSGGRRAKQFTYALFEERVPQTKQLPREEALGLFAGRFFRGHGPATLKDFRTWSGLAAADARAGLEVASGELASEVIHGKTFWFSPDADRSPAETAEAFLLPAYDEYLIAYHDRDALGLEPQFGPEVSRTAGQTILIDGQIVGTWKRTPKKEAALLEANLFVELDERQTRALEEAMAAHRHFAGMPVTVTISRFGSEG